MHDIDRTLNEYEGNSYYSGEYEESAANEWEYGYETEPEMGEVEEMEWAAELLEVTDEQELDQFLGKLIRKAGKAIGGFVKGPVGQQLGGLLKGVVKRALPTVAGTLGNLVVPGLGGIVGGKLGSLAAGALGAGELFGMELEGLSHEDQEFEAARRIVRFANAAAQKAAAIHPGTPAVQAARKALMTAARQHAPGLVKALSGAAPGVAHAAAQYAPAIAHAARQIAPGLVNAAEDALGGLFNEMEENERGYAHGGGAYGGSEQGGGAYGRRNSGRWIRRGNKIILLGV